MKTNLEAALVRVEEATAMLEQAANELRAIEGNTWEDHDFNGIIRVTGALSVIENNLNDRMKAI